MRHRRWTRLAIAVVGIMALSAYGLLGAQAAPNEFRPFEGTLEGTREPWNPPFPTPPDRVFFEVQGTFQANHMGHGTYEGVVIIDYPRHRENAHYECGFVSGEIVLTAANGDSLYGWIDQDRSVYCERHPTNAGDPMTLYVDVNGGTGRFAVSDGWYFVKLTTTGGPTFFEEAGYILGSIEY